MSIKGKVRFLPTENMYVFWENEISTLEGENETKFPKHIKVKLTKKVHKNNYFNNLP